jgi:hypothetical protein
MYALKRLFDKLLKIIFKIALIICLLMTVYYTYYYTMQSNSKVITLKVKITNKFEEDKGNTLYDKIIGAKGKNEKIRVEYLEKNDLKTNIFTISDLEYQGIEEGKIYDVKFKGNILKYIVLKNT